MKNGCSPNNGSALSQNCFDFTTDDIVCEASFGAETESRATVLCKFLMKEEITIVG
jgi:hypothetical protein